MHRFLAPAFLVALLLAGCGSDSEPAAQPAPARAPVGEVAVAPAGDLPADGASAYEIELRLHDGSGKPLAGVPVAIEVTGSGNRFDAPETTDASGRIAATLASTVAETKIVRFVAEVDGARAQVGRVLYLAFGPDAAASLFFDRAPVAVHAAIEFGVRVGSRDAAGNLSRDPIEVTLEAEGAELLGSTTVVAGANGIAFFPSLRIDRVATNVVLIATAPGFEPIRTAPFDVVAGGPASIAWSAQPAPAIAGETLAPVELTLRDAQGNLVEARIPVELSIAGGELLGTTTVAASGGKARFDDLRIERAGSWQLVANVRGVAPLLSAPFVVRPAAAAPATSTLAVEPAVLQAGETAAAVATIRDPFGNRIAGEAVAFEVTGAGVEILAADSATDATGAASLAFRSTTAEAKTVSATAAGFTLEAEVVFLPGAPDLASLVVEGADQEGTVDELLAEPIALIVTDAFGNPVVGMPVTFATDDAGVLVDPTEAITDEAGVASTTWKLGTVAGTQHLAATVADEDEPVIVAATAVAGAPATLIAISGDEQLGTAGAALAVPLQLQVEDVFGNPVAGADVAFAADAGSGSIDPAAATTDAAGVATATWTLGTTAGQQGAEATLADLPPVRFAATAAAGAAAQLFVESGDEQTGTVGQPLAQPLLVRVTDAHGNPVAGVIPAFTTQDGGAVSASAPSDVDGIATATWTLGTTAGAQEAEASLGGAVSVHFSASAAPGAPAALTAVSGGGQSGVVGTVADQPLRVRVTDQHGNGVDGIGVTFAGSGSFGTATPTDATGHTEVAYTFATTAGTDTVTASAPGLPAATFQLTASAGAVASLTVAGVPTTVAAGAEFEMTADAADNYGNPVPGASIAVNLTGPIEPVSLPGTDAAGRATLRLRSTGALGQVTVAVLSGGASSASFDVEVVTGPAARVEILSGDGQNGVVGLPFPQPLRFHVTDVAGNVVNGSAGGLGIGFSNAQVDSYVMDSDGTHVLVVTPTAAGPLTISAGTPTFEGRFTLRATANPRLERHAGNQAFTHAGSVVEVPLVVRLVDERDDPLAGFRVDFTPTSGPVALTTFATTDEQGWAWSEARPSGTATVQAAFLDRTVDFQLRQVSTLSEMACHFVPGWGIQTFDGAVVHWTSPGDWSLFVDDQTRRSPFNDVELQLRMAPVAGVPVLSNAIEAVGIYTRRSAAPGDHTIAVLLPGGLVEQSGTSYVMPIGSVEQLGLPPDYDVTLARLDQHTWMLRRHDPFGSPETVLVSESDGRFTSVVVDRRRKASQIGLCGDGNLDPTNDIPLVFGEQPLSVHSMF